MKKFHESIYRSITKAVTFRVLIIILDFIVIYLFTKRLDLTLGVIIVSNFSSTIAYFAHERVWNRVHWGKDHKE
jgi:adenylylsulfate kinase